MQFASFLYQIIIASMILPTVSMFLPAVSFPEDPAYLTAVVFGFAIAILAHENLLSFLTVQKVFLTRVITIMLLCTGFLIVAEATIPGVEITGIKFLEDNYGPIIISEQDVSKYVTMLVISGISSIIFYILKELKNKA